MLGHVGVDKKFLHYLIYYSASTAQLCNFMQGLRPVGNYLPFINRGTTPNSNNYGNSTDPQRNNEYTWVDRIFCPLFYDAITSPTFDTVENWSCFSAKSSHYAKAFMLGKFHLSLPMTFRLFLWNLLQHTQQMTPWFKKMCKIMNWDNLCCPQTQQAQTLGLTLYYFDIHTVSGMRNPVSASDPKNILIIHKSRPDQLFCLKRQVFYEEEAPCWSG